MGWNEPAIIPYMLTNAPVKRKDILFVYVISLLQATIEK
jgi:hypothetical protein